MADNKTAATSAAPGGSPTQGADASPTNGASPGASKQDLPAFLAGMGIEFNPGPAASTSGVQTTRPEVSDASTDDPDDTASRTEQDDDGQQDAAADDTKTAEGTVTAETADDGEPAESYVDEAGKIRLGRNEEAMIQQLKAAKADKALIGRTVDAFKREAKARLLRASAEQELATAREQLDTLQQQLAEAAEKSTVVPSGPLAHFSDAAQLDAEEARAVQFLEQAETDPLAVQDHYRLDDDGFTQAKRNAVAFIAAAKQQRKILSDRETTRAKVRTDHPALFNPVTDEGKLRLELYQTDPRTRPDYDELLAALARGRKIMEEERSGKFKYIKVDLEAAKVNGAKAHANGTAKNGNGSNGNGKETGSGKTEYNLPPPRRSNALRPAEGVNRLAELHIAARNGGAVDMDAMLDAQRGG